jgi:hypothetical protein
MTAFARCVNSFQLLVLLVCALCKFVSTPRSACRPLTHPSFVSSAANKRAPHGVEVDGGEYADETKHRSSLESCQLCRSRLMPAAADRLAKNHAAALMRCSGCVTCTSAACSSGNQGMWGDDTALPPACARACCHTTRQSTQPALLIIIHNPCLLPGSLPILRLKKRSLLFARVAV